MKLYKCFKSILCVICVIISQVWSDNCQAGPTEQTTVNVEMYFNGGTKRDYAVFKGMCGSRAKIPSSLVPITFKIGATVKKENGALVCRGNEHNKLETCNGPMRYACMCALLPEIQFYNFMCCMADTNFDMDECVKKINYTIALADGVAGKLKPSIDPEKIILDNSNAAVGFGANIDVDLPPYFKFNGNFDLCTSNQAAKNYAETICSMLKYEVSSKIPACN